MEFDRPILLLGPTRSGKTPVAALLGSLPEFARAVEPITIWDGKSPRLDDDVRTSDDATDAVVRRCRREIARFLAQAHGSRYVDDLPHHTLRVPFCQAVLPDVRFVCVFRDPREAISRMVAGWQSRDSVGQALTRRFAAGRHRSVRLSTFHRQAWRWLVNTTRRRLGLRRMTWGPTVPGQHEFARSHTLLETVAYQWSKLAEFSLDAVESLPPDRILVIRYEDLVSDPPEQMRRLAAFCEVEDVSALIDAAIRKLTPHPPEPDFQPTPEQWEEILRIAGPMVDRLGYAK